MPRLLHHISVRYLKLPNHRQLAPNWKSMVTH